MPVRILLVDDDRAFREELKCCLDEYECIEASSGAEALDLIRRPNEIDLVVLDVMMPGMNGTEVLREMKRIAPALGIIVMTGYSSEDVAIEALKGRADDYLLKGASSERVREIVSRHIEARDRRVLADGDARSKVERAKRFIERNCYKRTSLSDAARAVALSPKYLSRIFAEGAGMSFVGYRRRVKTAEGKQLLVRSGLTVEEIADRLGYRNAESFIRAFKAETGTTPSAFRRKKGVRRPRRKGRGR